MAELLASKVVVEEEEPRVRGIPSAPTSVAGAVGIAQRGPIGEPVLCTSFEDYLARFGSFTADSDLALAALGFFQSGGSSLWVSRTVHYTDPSKPETATAVRATGFAVAGGGPASAVLKSGSASPFALRDGDRVVVSINDAADVQAVFHGVPAVVSAGGAGPYALADGQTLTLRVGDGPEQAIVFVAADFASIAAAKAPEVAAALNALLEGGKAKVSGGIPRIATDAEGTAARIHITGGTANAALGFPTTPTLGDGNVASLRAVRASEVKSVVEAAIPALHVDEDIGGIVALRTDATGPTVTLQARPGTAPAFAFDTQKHTGAASGATNAIRIEGRDPGTYGNRVEVEIRAASDGSTRFDLLAIEDGVYRASETFANVSMLPGDARYVERVVNDARTGSALIRVTDLALASRPTPPAQKSTLGGGGDGLTALNDADFVGNEAGKTGLHAFDHVQDLSILLVPGRATPAVHAAMLRYCETTREGSVFAVLDPPAGLRATEMVSYVTQTAALEGASEFGAIYWPRIQILNPSRSAFGQVDRIVAPPSGVIAGVYSRTDSAHPGGVYDPPAGIDTGRMPDVLGFETTEVLEEKKRDLIYPHRINPLTTATGFPRYIDGSRTLAANGNFPFIAERRGVMFIARSVKAGLQFARHKNNTESLRAEVRRTITAFLLTQMNNGAFRSRDPSKAFFVDVSDALNPPSVVFAGKLIARIGLATNKPAEFIIVRISQDTRELEAELALSQAP